MLLERTITQLDIGPLPVDEARQMGQLGFMQWIAGLPNEAGYERAALYAYDKAAPFTDFSPAVAEFCRLLLSSIENPLKPLALSLPPKRRRGGANARRLWRLPL